MVIRKSTFGDLDSIMALFDIARMRMRRDGNTTQWIDGYPSREIAENDIRNGNSYVLEDEGGAYATFAMIAGEDPTYGHIEGRWPNNLPYVTLHRAASDDRHHGVLHDILQWVCGQYDNVRIDTHKDNHRMIHIAEKEGFAYCGVIYVANGTPRNAYQKVLDSSR